AAQQQIVWCRLVLQPPCPAARRRAAATGGGGLTCSLVVPLGHSAIPSPTHLLSCRTRRRRLGRSRLAHRRERFLRRSECHLDLGVTVGGGKKPRAARGDAHATVLQQAQEAAKRLGVGRTLE